MRTFLINLDKNPERLASAKRQLDAFGIAFERFSGVYGKGMSEDELKRHTSRFRAVLATGKPLAAGEIGCALSHLAIYRRMVEENVPFALVLEDDAKFTDRFPELLEKAVRFLDATRRQVVLFTRPWRTAGGCAPEGGIVPVRDRIAVYAEAYLITLPAAREIVRANYPIVVPCDTWHRFRDRLGVELYRALPLTVEQDKRNFGVSDVLQTRKTYRGLKWVLWKLARCVEVPLDRLIAYLMPAVCALSLLCGCSLFRPNPLEQRRGAVVLVFDTRTAGDLKVLRQTLRDHDARATVFASGQVDRRRVLPLEDFRSDGHEIGLSGLKGLDPQRYAKMYGQQKYFQDEIVTQVLGAERWGLNPRYYLLRYPSKMKAEALAIPPFLVSKGFACVVDLMPDFISPRAVAVSSLDSPSVLHAYRLTEQNFDRAQIASLASRNEILVVSPSQEILPDLLSEAKAQGVPFATVGEVRKGISGK